MVIELCDIIFTKNMKIGGTMYIRSFEANDAKKLAIIIEINLKGINQNDYSGEEIDFMIKTHNEKAVKDRAKFSHMYVACDDNGEVLGCGAIASYFGSKDESILTYIYVHPEYHARGIGKKIITTLEKDMYFVRSKRIEIPATINSHEFYRKLGYDFKDGLKKLDEERCYRLEKFNI
ncbi:MAG: GCN5-related N-acetyltransferase [Anaerocolumna sp.]|jgi:N-acetylglutamate synthase-like GNAT family acetyltransferase|nr:GCN5-related N-acetyltransferase [Anaerocolumna sp.]